MRVSPGPGLTKGNHLKRMVLDIICVARYVAACNNRRKREFTIRMNGLRDHW